MVTLFSKPRYLLSFSQFFENIMKHGRKWWDPNFWSSKSHTLAGYQSNCTTIQYDLPDAQNETYPYYTITNHSGWQELTPTRALTPLYLTHYTPSICVVCICRKNQYGVLFFSLEKTGIIILRKKKAEVSFSTKSLKSFFDAELFCVEAHKNVQA